MQHKPLSVTVSDHINGQDYTESTTEDGATSYKIDGEQTEKATWEVEAEKAQEEEIREATGSES